MGRIVIACYRPKPGRDVELLPLIKNHVPVLRAEGLATERTPIVGRAADGTMVEVFEWESQEAIDKAHTNAAVLKMWDAFGAVCDYVKLVDLREASEMFAGFEPLALD